jgi:predicted PurR-regulated permease PerM
MIKVTMITLGAGAVAAIALWWLQRWMDRRAERQIVRRRLMEVTNR